MSIDVNKADFEKALNDAQNTINELSGIVQENIIAPIQYMIGEYEGHLQGDIEDMVLENENLASENERLQDRIDELEGE